MTDRATAPAPAPTAAARPADAAPGVTPANRLVIFLLLISTFVVILNETIMGVALTDIMDDLGIQTSSGQWLTTVFMLTMAVVIPVTGFLLQRFPIRRVFIVAMSLFTTGTLICALAPGFGVLVVGRVVQAGGTAIMMPLLTTTVLNLVPLAVRGRMMGSISIVISVAPAIGPTISGLVLSVAPWRAIFWVVVPIAAAALLLGALRIRNVTETRRVPLDVLSVVLSALAFSGLIYGLSSLGEAAQGAQTLPLWLSLGTGGLALLLLVLRQLRLQRSDRALLDLRTFSTSTFTIANAMFAVSMIGMFGAIIVLPIYMQRVLGLSPLASGLMLLPGGLLTGLLAPVVGRLYDRIGPRPLVIPGSIAVSLALWGMTLFGQDTPWGFVLAGHMTLALGLALLFTPLFTAGLGGIRPHLYSHASAILGTIQQLAGAAGTALFVVVLTAQSVALAASGSDAVAAQAGGVRAAFFAGACVSLLAIVASVFVRRPVDPAGVGAGAGADADASTERVAVH